MSYLVSVFVDDEWLNVTDINPIRIEPRKYAHKFQSEEDAQNIAQKFNEAIVQKCD